MFVRVKKNRSGSSSVLVVRKASVRYLVVRNLGVATEEKAIESLRKKGEEWIRLHTDPLPMQFGFDEREEARRVLDNIDFVYHDGARIILNQVYHLIGFDEIKDGKTAESQIILGLLVSEDGYPLHYCIHRGDRHDGRTMIPAVNRFMKIFKLDKKDFIIVADAGLMSKDNVKLLKENDYSYIIGARIKNETAKVKDWILSLEKKPGTYHEYIKDTGDVTVEISDKLIDEDKRWDGLKGYVTNTDIDAGLVVDQYHGLSTVERSFRVSKGTLEMRPMFHFTPKRIGAHICMCFVALKVYKELERICKEKEIGMSVDSVIKVAKTIVTIKGLL